MSLQAKQIVRSGWNKRSSGRYVKNQTARKARRVPIEEKPYRVTKGFAD